MKDGAEAGECASPRRAHLPPLLATAPATRRLTVALADAAPAPDVTSPPPAVPPLRVSTLSPASVATLDRARAWPAVAPHATPFADMQVWDAAGASGACVRYSADDGGGGGAGLGVVADNAAVCAALLAAARASPAPPLEYFDCGPLTALDLPPYAAAGGAPLARATFARAAAPLTARLVVGADGARSAVRAAAGFRVTTKDYGRAAVVATVRTAAPHATAWQRFLPDGPLALLPLRGGYSGVVWTVRPGRAAELVGLGADAFAAAVDAALAGAPAPPTRGRFLAPPRVLPAPGAPAPASFPLRAVTAGRTVRPRLALAGDAARSIHPLAGQGANLGLADASALASALAAACAAGVDPGDAAWLEDRFGAPRRAAAGAVAAAVDGLATLFAPQAGPLATARALGVAAIDACPPARAAIVRFAAGGWA